MKFQESIFNESVYSTVDKVNRLNNYKTNSIGYSQIIGTRDKQEDFIKVRIDISGAKDTRYLMTITDGMGGYAGGELAAEVFTSYFHFEKHEISNNLKKALTEANKRISDEILFNFSLRGMGTTIVAAAIYDEKLAWASVGDSILWLFRNGKLQRKNADHSMTPLLNEKTGLGEEDVSELKSPQKNQLRSVLNGSKLELVDISLKPFKLKKNDLIIIASDGVLVLDELTMERIICNFLDSNVQHLADIILQEISALKQVAQDNASIAIYHHT